MANLLDLIKGEGQAIVFIRELAKTALTGTEILGQLRAAGLGIRTQTGYNAINYFRSIVQPAGQYTKFLNLNAYPTISRLPLSATKQLRNFSYWVDVRGFSKTTGEIQTTNIKVSSSQLLTKQQAIDIAVSLGEGGSGNYAVTGGSGTVTDIFQNSDGLTSL